MKPAANAKQFDFLLIDGYNIIYDWKSLADLAKTSLELARDKLIDMLANYQGFKGLEVIIVFDAHKIRSGRENIIKQGGITLVYTAEFETADAYIERAINNLPPGPLPYRIAVATSDSLEQVITMAKGAYRLSARDLLTEVEAAQAQIRQKIADRPIKNNQLSDNLDPATAQWLEKSRRGQGNNTNGL